MPVWRLRSGPIRLFRTKGTDRSPRLPSSPPSQGMHGILSPTGELVFERIGSSKESFAEGAEAEEGVEEGGESEEGERARGE